MSNYSTQTAYDLLSTHLEARTDITNLGAVAGDLFLSMAGILKKHFYQEARKVDPTRFQLETSVAVSGATELAIADFESLNGNGCGVFESDSDNAITDTPLVKTNRGSQSDGWWWDSKNQKVKFTGSLSDTYWVVYLPTQAKPSAMDSDLLVPKNNDEFVLNYLQRLFALWDFNGTGGGKISLADQQLSNSMRRLLENLEAPSDGLPTNSAYL